MMTHLSNASNHNTKPLNDFNNHLVHALLWCVCCIKALTKLVVLLYNACMLITVLLLLCYTVPNHIIVEYEMIS